MTDAHDLGGKIRAALYGVIDHYVAALPLGVKAINSGGMPGSASKTAPPPVPLGNLDARIDCHRDLHFWCRFVMGEVRDVNGGSITTRVDALDPIALARFLVVWADQLARLDPEEAENCAREMDGHATTLKALALPDPPSGVVIGRCPIVTDTDACGGTVRSGEQIRCQRCGTTGSLDWWHALMFGDTELAALVTARDLVGIIANQTGVIVDAATIRKWVERGKVQRSGADEKGRPLYDHVSVIALVRLGKVA